MASRLAPDRRRPGLGMTGVDELVMPCLTGRIPAPRAIGTFASVTSSKSQYHVPCAIRAIWAFDSVPEKMPLVAGDCTVIEPSPVWIVAKPVPVKPVEFLNPITIDLPVRS